MFGSLTILLPGEYQARRSSTHRRLLRAMPCACLLGASCRPSALSHPRACLLPGPPQGGELVVTHSQWRARVDVAAKNAAGSWFQAFYAGQCVPAGAACQRGPNARQSTHGCRLAPALRSAALLPPPHEPDCEHEVLPLLSGHRLALTYNLVAPSGPLPAVKPSEGEPWSRGLCMLLGQLPSAAAASKWLAAPGRLPALQLIACPLPRVTRALLPSDSCPPAQRRCKAWRSLQSAGVRAPALEAPQTRPSFATSLSTGKQALLLPGGPVAPLATAGRRRCNACRRCVAAGMLPLLLQRRQLAPRVLVWLTCTGWVPAVSPPPLLRVCPLHCRYSEASLRERGIQALKGHDREVAEVGGWAAGNTAWQQPEASSCGVAVRRCPRLQGSQAAHVWILPNLRTPGPAAPQLLRAACQAGARLDAQLALVSVMLVASGEDAFLPPDMEEEFADEMGFVSEWMDIRVGGLGTCACGRAGRAGGYVAGLRA